jgi:pimeloyl-ACP methyl ester carboxylesterase
MSLPVSRRVSLSTGLRYHFLEWGGDDQQIDHTVVLVHGFLDLSWTWEAVVAAGLAGKYHVVAPDLRGHGDSDRVGPGGYYHFMDYLADLEDFIAKVGRGRVSLVGHSMGGSVSAYFTGVYPQRISKLALLEGLGPPDNDWSGWPDRLSAWISAWKRQSERGSSKRYATIEEAAARLRATDPKLGPELALRLAEVSTVRTPDGRFQFKHDPLHLTPAPSLFMVDGATTLWRRIACETLLIDGQDSEFRYSPEDATRRRAAIPNARHVELAEAGHMMQRHQPALLAQILDEFLADPAR